MTKDNYLQNEIDKTYKLIYEYVDKDPTKFCTMEEFELAVKTIKTFINLRIKSIEGQLDGSIPSTDSGQSADSSNLIDTGTLSLSDMGSMCFGGGRDNGGPPGGPMGTSGSISNVTNTDYLWTFASVIAILIAIAFAYNFNKKWYIFKMFLSPHILIFLPSSDII